MNHLESKDRYLQCCVLVEEILECRSKRKQLVNLRGDDAQTIIDFLDKLLVDHVLFPGFKRKPVLHLLSNLAKSAQVFPQRLEIEDPRCDLTDPITEGGFGCIYKAENRGEIICVKAARLFRRDGDVNRQHLRAHAGELILWAHIWHPNILAFRGIFLTDEEIQRVCIVSPWMENGDLLQYLKSFPDAPRAPLLHDVISGLQYLHDLDIVHADLKGKNVLVSDTGHALLADFGLSRFSMTAPVTTTGAAPGTAYWMSPELLLDDEPQPSHQSDVWAFGCTCFEALTGLTPFREFKTVPHLALAYVKGKPTLRKPESATNWDSSAKKIWSLILFCCKRDPKDRPDSKYLQEELARISGRAIHDKNQGFLAMPRLERLDSSISIEQVYDVLFRTVQSSKQAGSLETPDSIEAGPMTQAPVFDRMESCGVPMNAPPQPQQQQAQQPVQGPPNPQLVWEGTLSLNGTGSDGNRKEVHTRVSASSSNAGNSHSQTWPSLMTLLPAMTPQVSLPEFQDWIRRTKPVLCTFKARGQEDQANYNMLADVMSQKRIYATASWVLPNGVTKENVLIFPINQMGLCGAFFPLTGIPEMPKPQQLPAPIAALIQRLPPEQHAAAIAQIRAWIAQGLE